MREKAKTLKIDAEMLKRPVNVGFSGGEKKRNEILQMAMLEPQMCILDETDSGLDVDAMKLVAEGVNALRDAGRSFLVITHYQRLLDHIKPDVVHIMADGRIVKTGGPELALEVENNGYADILAEAVLMALAQGKADALAGAHRRAWPVAAAGLAGRGARRRAGAADGDGPAGQARRILALHRSGRPDRARRAARPRCSTRATSRRCSTASTG